MGLTWDLIRWALLVIVIINEVAALDRLPGKTGHRRYLGLANGTNDSGDRLYHLRLFGPGITPKTPGTD